VKWELFLWQAIASPVRYRSGLPDIKKRERHTRSAAAESAQIMLHFIIFEWYEQHSETFSFFFVEVFVVYFMRFTESNEVFVFGVFKPFKALMD